MSEGAESLLTFASTGCQYEGTLAEGDRMEGRGVYTFSNGTVYEGEFKDGMFHGEGELRFPSGSQYKGVWELGRRVSGEYFYQDDLVFEKREWEYCTDGDRRFYTEVLSDRAEKTALNMKFAEGIEPAKPKKILRQ